MMKHLKARAYRDFPFVFVDERKSAETQTPWTCQDSEDTEAYSEEEDSAITTTTVRLKRPFRRSKKKKNQKNQNCQYSSTSPRTCPLWWPPEQRKKFFKAKLC